MMHLRFNNSSFLSKDKHVLSVIGIDKLLERLKKSNELLELILKVKPKNTYKLPLVVTFTSV
jgi:hypothetical protein